MSTYHWLRWDFYGETSESYWSNYKHHKPFLCCHQVGEAAFLTQKRLQNQDSLKCCSQRMIFCLMEIFDDKRQETALCSSSRRIKKVIKCEKTPGRVIGPWKNFRIFTCVISLPQVCEAWSVEPKRWIHWRGSSSFTMWKRSKMLTGWTQTRWGRNLHVFTVK